MYMLTLRYKLEGVAFYANTAHLGGKGLFPKVAFQNLRREDCEMAFTCVAQSELISDYGVCDRVDVQLVHHVDGVGVGRIFDYLDEAFESVVVEPSLKGRGDDDRHGSVCVGESRR